MPNIPKTLGHIGKRKFTVSLGENLLRRLKALAALKGLTIEQLCQQIFEAYLLENEPAQEPERGLSNWRNLLK